MSDLNEFNKNGFIIKKKLFSNDEINKIKGENWLSFFRKSFNSN